MIGKQGKIYVTTSNNTLHIFNQDGTIEHSVEIHGANNLAAGSNGEIYVSANNYVDSKSTLYKIDEFGNIIWEKELDNHLTKPVIGEDGTIYISSFHALHAVNPDGTTKWNLDLDETEVPIVGTRPPKLTSNGDIIVSMSNKISFISKEGVELWSIIENGKDFSEPEPGKDGVFYFTKENTLNAYDSTGRNKWTYVLPSGTYIGYSKPTVLSNGYIVVIKYTLFEDESTLLVFHPEGFIVGEYSFRKMTSPLEGKNHDIYLGTKTGLISLSMLGEGEQPPTGEEPTTGWKQIDGKMYYFDESGVMKTGWLQSGGKWYYFNPSGDMVIGWKKINNKWYYFYSNGNMAYNTTIQGYKLGKDGALIP